MDGLKIISTGASPARLAYIGTVVDVINAHLPKNLENKRFSVASFAAAFELGTPKDKHSLGECIALNGQCYTTSTDQKGLDYYKTIHGPSFMTSGIFILPNGVKPTHQIQQNSLKKALPILKLYEQIYANVKQACAFVGTVIFDDFHSTAICKAPIDGKNIFENKAEYYAEPEIREKNMNAFIMGVVADFADSDQTLLNKELEVVLYHNPFDTNQALTHHAHVLTLKKPVEKWQTISPKDAGRSLHLFADGSNIKNINIDIFAISGLDDFEKNGFPLSLE